MMILLTDRKLFCPDAAFSLMDSTSFLSSSSSCLLFLLGELQPQNAVPTFSEKNDFSARHGWNKPGEIYQ